MMACVEKGARKDELLQFNAAILIGEYIAFCVLPGNHG
jgi:hypothetical protein